MIGSIQWLRSYFESWCAGWDRFWFQPSSATTLGLLRVFAGAMLLYTHFVWGLGLDKWFGPSGQLSAEFTKQFHGRSPFAWSHFYWLDGSPTLLFVIHILALVVLSMFFLGVFTRYTSILAFLITVSYANRATGALFGLDQINAFLALYLAVGASGDAFSVDQWIRRLRGKATPPSPKSNTTIAIRLIQLHMCVVYLFAGLGKLQGESWWNGEAFWGAAANQEYQTLNLLWLVHYPWLVNLITHVTIGWEVSYSALVWPKLTRPLVLLMAIPLHLGIAFGMGMITFGVIMLVGNFAFVPPQWIEAVISKLGLNSHGKEESNSG